MSAKINNDVSVNQQKQSVNLRLITTSNDFDDLFVKNIH